MPDRRHHHVTPDRDPDLSGVALRPVGWVRSTLATRDDAPRQPGEGAPSAWLDLEEASSVGLDGLVVGARLVVLTWLHRAERDVLRVHPRGDDANPERGVFTTRSPDRPNPIGLHEVTVTAIDGRSVQVDALEAIDGTPVLDLKPAPGC